MYLLCSLLVNYWVDLTVAVVQKDGEEKNPKPCNICKDLCDALVGKIPSVPSAETVYFQERRCLSDTDRETIQAQCAALEKRRCKIKR